jgi:hypothetical protein
MVRGRSGIAVPTTVARSVGGPSRCVSKAHRVSTIREIASCSAAPGMVGSSTCTQVSAPTTQRCASPYTPYASNPGACWSRPDRPRPRQRRDDSTAHNWIGRHAIRITTPSSNRLTIGPKALRNHFYQVPPLHRFGKSSSGPTVGSGAAAGLCDTSGREARTVRQRVQRSGWRPRRSPGVSGHALGSKVGEGTISPARQQAPTASTRWSYAARRFSQPWVQTEIADARR